MKKIIITLLLVVSLSLGSAIVVSAADIDLVTDITDTLTPQQVQQLNERAERITQQYSCDVAIVIIDRMTDNTGAFSWAIDIYQEFDFGYGPEKSGLLLFLSMAERDYYLISFGFGSTAFTDHGKKVMLDNHILPLLGDNKFYDAFSVYLNKAEEFLKLARDGTPFNRDTDPEAMRTTFLIKLSIVILLPLLIAFLVCSMWKSKMKTARIATTACNYIPPGGFRLTGQADTYLYRTVTRTKVSTNSSGSSSSSGGFSGRGGKF